MEAEVRHSVERAEHASGPAATAGEVASSPTSQETAAERRAGLAGRDPWLSPAPFYVAPDERLGYERSVLRLPRESMASATEVGQAAGLLTGGCVTPVAMTFYNVIAVGVVQSLLTALTRGGISDAQVSGIGMALILLLNVPLLCATLYLLPRAIGARRAAGLRERWERVYRETYRLLCDTGLSVLIADDELWRTAFSSAAANYPLKIVGLGPPRSPEEALRMAAAFWPHLLRHLQGEHDALAQGIYEGYRRFTATGRQLTCGTADAQFDLRARVAALADFFLDLPPDLPAYRPPPPLHTTESLAEPRGYDYRLRPPEERRQGES